MEAPINNNILPYTCRLCAKKKDQIGSLDFKDNNDLMTRINKVLPVTVAVGDGFPQKICETCAEKVSILSDFYDETARAKALLLSEKESALASKFVIKSLDKQKLYTCKKCACTLTSISAAINHVCYSACKKVEVTDSEGVSSNDSSDTSVGVRITPSKCEDQEKTLDSVEQNDSNKPDSTKRLTGVRSPQVKRRRSRKSSESDFSVNCNVCSMSFSTEREFYVHQVVHNTGGNESILEANENETHDAEEKNGKGQQNVCQFCGARFTRKSSYISHKQSHLMQWFQEDDEEI